MILHQKPQIKKLFKKIKNHSLPTLILKAFGKAHRSLSQLNLLLRKIIPESIDNYQLKHHRPGTYSKIERAAEQPRLNILLPSLKEKAIFGGTLTAAILGFITKYRHPQCRLRFLITEDYAPSSPIHTKLRQYLAEDICKIPYEIEDLTNSALQPVALHDREQFIATFWNTCYLLPLGTASFFYLVQDYEPAFYPWGDEYVAAQATYTMNCIPIFNTSLLREFFSMRKVFANGLLEKSLSFEPALHKNLLTLQKKQKNPDEKKVLLFYGRPGTPRNLFLTGVNALSKALDRRLLNPDEWEFLSAGEMHPHIALGRNAILKSVGKLTLDQYYSLLARVDIGLSLMASPHPSYPPLEMASLGALCITNSFENKNLSSIHPSILTCEPSSQGILSGLKTATAMLKNHVPPTLKFPFETDWEKALGRVVDKIIESLK